MDEGQHFVGVLDATGTPERERIYLAHVQYSPGIASFGTRDHIPGLLTVQMPPATTGAAHYTGPPVDQHYYTTSQSYHPQTAHQQPFPPAHFHYPNAQFAFQPPAQHQPPYGHAPPPPPYHFPQAPGHQPQPYGGGYPYGYAYPVGPGYYPPPPPPPR
ncbi:hypothetical protein FRC09_014016 [Ceratobasidium sp. 395]|nr:hypothetical protein FRC09_014016 [Ceratobasidium sp. 395]